MIYTDDSVTMHQTGWRFTVDHCPSAQSVSVSPEVTLAFLPSVRARARARVFVCVCACVRVCV